MKKTWASAFTFVGTVIGAGFATGKEIALYFASCSVFTVILAGVFLGFFCYVFLRLSVLHGNVFLAFGKFDLPVRVFVILSDFCVLCATCAGSEDLVRSVFSVNGGGVLIGFLALLVVLIGVRYVRGVNLLVVPVIVLLVTVVFLRDPQNDVWGKQSVVLPWAYASMNVVTGGFTLCEAGKDLSNKQCVACAVLAGGILTLLLVFVYLTVKNVSAEMPFLQKADELGFSLAGNIVLLLALFTTAIGTLTVCVGKKKDLAFPIVVAALVASLFGFEGIVNRVYPVMGSIGAAIMVYMVIKWVISVVKERKKLSVSHFT